MDNASSVSFQSGSSVAAYETASIEVAYISPHIDGNYEELHDGDNGPEGKMPQPPKVNGLLRIFILNEAARKIVELKDAAGNVIAKVTWTLSDVTGFIDDWTGPNQVWSSKIEVVQGYGGNGLGLWLWKFAERIFYQPGMTRAIIDEAVTSSGQRGWTSFFLPEVLDFIGRNVSGFNMLMSDPNTKIWIFQYPY